jgi:RNA polymerase sigma-70 factor, ECF subfamily
MTGGADESSLVARFRDGDPAATAQMYARYGRLVYAVAWRVLGERGAAEEATQQAFVQAWRHAADLAAERDPAPWLATIARRVAIDIARHRGRRPALVGDDDGVIEALTAHPEAEDLWRTWRVREEIERLDPREREVIRLQHQQGMTHGEIAERLGVPLGTVKSRSFRAHRQLATALADLRPSPHRADAPRPLVDDPNAPRARNGEPAAGERRTPQRETEREPGRGGAP